MGAARRYLIAHVEAVKVGQGDIDQHHLGIEACRSEDGGGPVRGLPDDVEALVGQQCARERPEPRVVVDDEQGAGHT